MHSKTPCRKGLLAMSESPSYVSQPQVIDLPKLLADVRAGHIQVPRFQRPFVWEDERRVELLRSLRVGIPIGSLLVWRTSQNRLRCFDGIAGVSIPEPAKGQTVSYLLDGHQRLTTLFAAFASPQLSISPPPASDSAAPESIYFDMEQNDFVVGNPTGTWSCLPLHLFLDAVALRQHFRNKEREGRITATEIDRLQSIAEGVLYAMQWCRIPVIPLSTDDVELATRTFHRVNSQGVPMTEVHMVAALTWGDNFDLRECFEQAWSDHRLPNFWQPAAEQQTLNVLKGLLGMDLSRSPGALLVRRIREKHDVAGRSVELLVHAMNLAAGHLVHTPIAIPYQMQLTLTAIALQEIPQGAPIDEEWLRRWWGLTTAWGSFASSATHRVQAALRHLRAGLQGKHEPWSNLLYHSAEPSPLPNLELRNARARYFIDGYANDCDRVELLHKRGNRAVVSLIRGEGTRPGNRFLWESERVEQLTQALENQDIDSLKKHFVDADCLDAWGRRDFQGFFEAREALMNQVEGAWFEGLHASDFIAGKR
ncbi:DUF262 domain-containing protein [Achromobacter xylosoxidans]|uniref:GmrSD restriction endonuclease domain-containing protein n=1 Tax=Alcaligenes xylosoxydans xylosoxydans TaxID=85698 RepID=UPI0009E67C0C